MRRWRQLCSIGPSGFAAYARVFHPTDEDTADVMLRQLNAEGSVDDAIFEVVRDVLVRHTSTEADSFHALWEGHGEIHGGLVISVEAGRGSISWKEPPAFDEEVLRGPRVVIPARSYFLFRGPLSDARCWPSRDGRHMSTPNLLWPTDRAWFLATEIDLPWTGVGGSVELVDELLASKVLDVVPATASADLPYGRD